MDNLLGSNRIAQIGIIVSDIEKTAATWARNFGYAMPEIIITDTVDVAHTEYQGESTQRGQNWPSSISRTLTSS